MTRFRGIDDRAPLQFLRQAYEPDDWLAVFLKSYETRRTAQRIGPLSRIETPRFQAWLRAENAHRVNVYISVNALKEATRSRRRESVKEIRHIVLDADEHGQDVLATIAVRRDLPPPSYVLHSSPGRLHVLWRVRGFTIDRAETLQKHLARELGTDPAATSCTQTTRLPGFFTHKPQYGRAHLVTIEYQDAYRTYTPAHFPIPVSARALHPRVRARNVVRTNPIERARRYLGAIPPAIAGQHGDVQTFRVCCRLVRGFALDDEDAVTLLTEWNAQCRPPWSDRELREKVRRARRYGREPIGGLLEAQP
jgi:hypothetical protein